MHHPPLALDKRVPRWTGCPASMGLPFFQIQGLWPSVQGSVPLPTDLSVPLVQPVPVGHHSFRLLLEESAFQALSEEPLLKRLHTECAALPGGEGSLLSIPFPTKHGPLSTVTTLCPSGGRKLALA